MNTSMFVLKYDQFPIVATKDLTQLSPTHTYDKIKTTLAFLGVFV